VLNDIASRQDWLPTLLAAAGEPDIAQKLLDGHQAGDKTFKVHIDGYNLLPYLTGEAKESPRKFFSTSAMTATSWGFAWMLMALKRSAVARARSVY
jgi:arylsulfatase A-like enzyme